MKKKSNPLLTNLLITAYSAEGKSLARHEGKVIFIPNAVPGDVVDVQLTKNKKDWAEGFVTHFHKYAEDRVTPICKHFGTCGGCQWQMLPYDKQLVYKEQQVCETLQRIAKVQLPEVLTIIGADNCFQYRNKIEYTFSTKKFIPYDEFRLLEKTPLEENSILANSAAGFHAKGMFDKIVAIDVCHLQAEPTNLLRNAIADFAKKYNYPFYDIKNHEGWLRTMIVRNTTLGEWLVNIVVGYEDAQMQQALFQFIQKNFSTITTLLFTINSKHNDSIYDLIPEVYSGVGFIMEQLENFRFKISPQSFFQTNTKQAEKLYHVVRDFATLTGKEIVYDLYCGTGSIGIFCSQKAKKIIGVELIEAAIADAKENAAINQLQNAEFFSGDVTKICDNNFFATNGKPDVIITDPPRAGMHQKLIDKLLEIAAPIIVYVSCNPATQARDISLLDEQYRVTKIQPVDMFPHTHHIENVVCLQLR